MTAGYCRRGVILPSTSPGVVQTCFYSTSSSCIPSCFAKVLIANSKTADWLIPRRCESFLSKIVAVCETRILVFIFVMLTLYHKLWYNVCTCKPVGSLRERPGGQRARPVRGVSPPREDPRRAGSGFVGTQIRLWS